MQHVDGLSRKAYTPNDVGVIPDISDNTWLPLIKEKVVASLVTERTKRTIRKLKRYHTHSESDTKTEVQRKTLPKRTTMDPLIGGRDYQPKPEPPEHDSDWDLLLRTPSPLMLALDEPEIDLFYHGYDGDQEIHIEDEDGRNVSAPFDDLASHF